MNSSDQMGRPRSIAYASAAVQLPTTTGSTNELPMRKRYKMVLSIMILLREAMFCVFCDSAHTQLYMFLFCWWGTQQNEVRDLASLYHRERIIVVQKVGMMLSYIFSVTIVFRCRTRHQLHMKPYYVAFEYVARGKGSKRDFKKEKKSPRIQHVFTHAFLPSQFGFSY